MAHERLKPNYTFDEEKLKQLRQLVPECFEDGKINFETLRQNLGDWVQDDEDPELEHFGLFWPGKKEARKAAAIPPQGTLEPVYGEGLKADGSPDTDGQNDSKNIFIEGENLEVLKILQKSYAGKIKMIYIDPPYNTGNDFIYDDDFAEPLQEYLRRTGQVDEEGKAMTTNKRSDGRFHSNWLSMMYPRLRLARNLLREDGVIFVSIDDNEVIHLRALMNEVFGEENFIEQICWKNKYGAGAQTKGFISVHEYVLCFSKEPILNLEAPLDEEARKAYNKKDDKYELRGGYFTQPLMTNSLGDRPNLQYAIEHEGEMIQPNKQWVWSEERLLKAIDNDEVEIKRKKNGGFSVRSKQYLRDENGIERRGKPLSLMNGPYTQQGTNDIVDLFGYNPFGFVKPVSLIQYLFSFSINDKSDEPEIYMDFFSGSGTSAQSVLNLNKSDDKQRQYVCVQLPIDINQSDSSGKKAAQALIASGKRPVISELTKQRLRLVDEKHKKKAGFKVFKLNNSNYKKWSNYQGTELTQLESSLEIFNQNPLKEGWSVNGLLTEVLLGEGFALSASVQPMEAYNANTVYHISDEFCEHHLLVCLDPKVEEATISALSLSGNDIFICLDSAISNVDKLRLSDKGLIKTI